MTVKLKTLPATIESDLPRVSHMLTDIGGLVALWLFGSHARGQTTPLSDVDIAYLPQKNLSGRARDTLDRTLFHRLCQALHTDEITLVDMTALSPSLAFAVLREGKMLNCHDALTLQTFTETVLPRYGDARRLHREILSDFTRKEKKGMSVDRITMLNQLRSLRIDLRKLREKNVLTKERYMADTDAQTIVERKFQTAIESCVNIGNHLIARLELPLAEEYAQVFHILRQERILDKGLADAMADMARFRNLLVHVYWQVDHDQVYDRMRPRIVTLEKFARAIERLLKRKTGEKTATRKLKQ